MSETRQVCVGISQRYTAFYGNITHMPKEIVVDWVTQNGAGKVSVFWFDTATAIAGQRSALNTFLSAVDGSLDNGVSWSIRQVGRVVDDATGALTGSWTNAVGFTGVGAAVGEPVADATQVLFQWHTGSIVGGRFLRGRTFVPGLAAGQVVNGNLASAQVTGLQAVGNTLATSGQGLGVWHRPTAGLGGSFVPVNSCTVWPELAVLRRRRY